MKGIMKKTNELNMKKRNKNGEKKSQELEELKELVDLIKRRKILGAVFVVEDNKKEE